MRSALFWKIGRAPQHASGRLFDFSTPRPAIFEDHIQDQALHLGTFGIDGMTAFAGEALDCAALQFADSRNLQGIICFGSSMKKGRGEFFRGGC